VCRWARAAPSGRPVSGRGREGFGEVGSPFKQEKDPLIRRETLELVRAYNKIEEERVRDSIFATAKDSSLARLGASVDCSGGELPGRKVDGRR